MGWRTWLRDLSKSARALDLRFEGAADEAAFKQSLEDHIVLPSVICSSLISGLVVISIYSHIVRERGHEDNVFKWEASDPRTFFFCLSLAFVMVLLVPAFIGALRLCYGVRLRWWSWEHISAGCGMFITFSFSVMSAWHTAVLFGKRPEDVWAHDTTAGEYFVVLCQLATVMFVCTYVPIRTHILMIVPLCVPVCYVLSNVYLGSPHPDAAHRIAPGLVFMCFFQYHGARRNERFMREKWLALRRVEVQDTQLQESALLAKALQAMACTTSDIILMVDQDLKVIHCDETHRAFFGKDVAGFPLEDLLSAQDRSRYRNIVQEASRNCMIQSIPVVLDLDFATVQAQLTLIDTCGIIARYLIGLQTCSQTLKHEASSVPTPLERINEHDIEATSESALDSVVSTTPTGQVFANFSRMKAEDGMQGDIAQGLEHIVEMGSREHWLIDTQEVELSPSRILGIGGFGTVILGRFRGTALVAKVPHLWKEDTCSQLAALCNELRVHRHIRHPNVALFFGACINSDSGQLALLYEFVPGHRLADYVSGLARNSKGLIRTKLLLDVASALRYLHSLRPALVHGDVKPENIMVEPGLDCPRAKLLDFGLSRLRTKRARPLGGTQVWMAPELVLGQALAPMPSADVFSFGLLAFFVLTGRSLPKTSGQGEGATPPGSFTSGKALPEELRPEQLGHDCFELCRVCLRFDPQERPEMENVQTMLFDWLPCCREQLQKLGPGVLALIAQNVVNWATGIAMVQANDPAAPRSAKANPGTPRQIESL